MPEIPTIADLLGMMGAQRDYPYVFSGAKSAAVFFCAACYGKWDAIYYYDYKIPDVTLVDTDAEKLKAMASIYPEGWKYITADAFDYAGRCLWEGRKFDVVSCDPFTNLVPRVLINDFDKFYSIANKYLVARVTYGNFFEKYNVEPTEEALAEFLTKEHKKTIKVRELNEVSTFDGGCYWAVIECGKNS